jgi:hypothetical protein
LLSVDVTSAVCRAYSFGVQQVPQGKNDDFGSHVAIGDFQSQWANDTGEADPLVRGALASKDLSTLMLALAPSRLFIALVPEVSGDPSEGDKNSDMSVACLRATDGRMGLLCFTGVDTLTRWNSRARPVPLSAADAAEAALDEKAQAIILDLGSARPRTLTLADIVVLSNKDQRKRAVQLVSELLGKESEGVTFNLRVDGVLQINSVERLIAPVQAIVQTNDVLHSLVPEGIAISAIG